MYHRLNPRSGIRVALSYGWEWIVHIGRGLHEVGLEFSAKLRPLPKNLLGY